MIVSKTPFRISFVGGGSDLSTFYSEEMGAVISTSIEKYMYICVNKKFDGRIRISYSKTEDVPSNKQIHHPLVRETLQLLGIDGGIEISSMADIPSNGSGLGSSSSYTVGLLNALFAYKNQFVSKEKLASLACQVEIERCSEPIGKQDQYAASFGGLNVIRFHPDESVSIDPIICNPVTLKRLEKSILLFFTGRTRSASSILSGQFEAMKNKSKRILVRRMVQLALEMKYLLEMNSLEGFGELLEENWRLKTQLSNSISDPQVESWYSKAKANGAEGGKVLGAGNGGFILFYADPERHADICNALHEIQSVKIRFDRSGSQIIHYQQNI